MKIGIVTFHSAHNYGAVLQAWSLQEYLKQQGHQVEIVNLRLAVIDKLYRLTYKTNRRICKSAAINKLANSMYYKLRCEAYRFKDAPKYEKYHKFEHFINDVLPTTEEFKNYQELCKAKLKYDALIVGSDQVWNATMMRGIDPAYFLQFSDENTLRISYAASIGTDEIPAKYQLLFKRYLREFDAISVREKKAQESIEQLTDQKVEVVADPTFLLTEKDFSALEKKTHIKGKYIYVHNVHLKKTDESLNSVVEELSKRLNLPVVHNWSEKVFSNEAGHFSGGVDEFLGVISGAEYIVTNSFHCTAFAITYHKDFITIPHIKNPDRMKNLLSELDLSNHLIDDGDKIPENLDELLIDYEKVEVNKTKMREQAQEFLRNALNNKKEKDDRTYFEYEDVFRCCGCEACKDICPVNAITMKADKEGFVYPVINEEICIHCDKCKKTCIYHQKRSKNESKPNFPVVYAAYSKNEEIHKKSTSGGMFTPMYRNILGKGGKVIGVRYDKDMHVIYDVAEEETQCELFRGSKYVQADSSDIKPKVKQLLDEDQYVLFSGTPCQIAGLKSYLQKDYPKLYTVELICHGVASPKIFKKYVDYLEEVYKSKIVGFEFRNKFKGVNQPFVLVEFESGSIDIELASKNNLNRGFLSNNIQRPSCYICEFAGLKPGVADFTIGDYWGLKEQHPEFCNDRGVSILKINTEKGIEFFEEIKDEFALLKSTYEKAYAANHVKPMLMKGGRSRLMYYIDEKPIDDLLLTFNHLKKGGIKGL